MPPVSLTGQSACCGRPNSGDSDGPANLLEQTGAIIATRDSYLWAAKMTASLPEQRYLELRAARLHQPLPPTGPTGQPPHTIDAETPDEAPGHP